MLHIEDSKDLPESFVPADEDVIVGWARQNYHHAGNQRLRELVVENVPRYKEARSKTEKGDIISSILDQLRKESPTGVGIVRLNKETGRWTMLGDDKAKDKIGHALRKASQGMEKKSKKKQEEEETSVHEEWNAYWQSHPWYQYAAAPLPDARSDSSTNQAASQHAPQHPFPPPYQHPQAYYAHQYAQQAQYAQAQPQQQTTQSPPLASQQPYPHAPPPPPPPYYPPPYQYYQAYEQSFQQNQEGQPGSANGSQDHRTQHFDDQREDG